VTRQPVPRGTGVLLLTELYPYAQLQLLVRYWTDDLVELAKPCPIGGFGIFFRGRRASSAIIPRADGDALVVGSLQVGEVCADVADVAVDPIAWAPWAVDVGPPRFSLHAADRDIVVTVALRYAPSVFPTRAGEVRARIVDDLRREVTGLAGALDRGEARLHVDAVGPGHLREATKV